jgi:AraC family transcriptional regulator of adaptative response / DNA-3-methyladenine glycosylase II
MRLIADGVVDREGVAGLAGRLGYSERHVHRQLVAVLGAGALALARAQRAQTARVLLETTQLPIAAVAFAAGFGSVRQFNDTIRHVFALTPGALRTRARRVGRPADSGAITLRLPYRAPLDAVGLIDYFAMRAVPGIEEVVDGVYRRSVALPHGPAVIELMPRDGHVEARFLLEDVRDLAVAVQRGRWLFDLDSDPQSVLDALCGDALIGPLARNAPGRRVPGHVDPHELAVRAVLGQQVSLAGAATLAGRIVREYGEPLPRPVGSVTHLFPTAEALAAVPPERLAMPASRKRALRAITAALAAGDLVLDAGADRVQARRRLLELPGIGPWTTEYIAMRALRDPDAFPPGDLGVRRALERLGHDGRPPAAAAAGERWRPYRAYALQHLWGALAVARAAGDQSRTTRRALAA